MTIGNFPPHILEAYKWDQTGAHEATGKNDCPITSNGAFCAGWRSNNTSWYYTEGCGDSYYNNFKSFVNSSILYSGDSLVFEISFLSRIFYIVRH